MTQSKTIAQAMFESYSAGEDWPLPSQAIPGMNAGIAYQIQHAFVAHHLQSDTIAGFKAGASAVPAQQMFGLDGPFCAVLLAAGNRPDGGSIAGSDFRSLMLETELCFRVGKNIGEPIGDVDALKQHIDGCFPAIELADTGGYALIESGKRYPPALALARQETEEVFEGHQPSIEEFQRAYIDTVRHHLSHQHEAR